MKPAWRTVITLLSLAAMAGVSAVILVRFGDTGKDVFKDLSLTYVLLGGGQVVKSGVQHLALGGGIKGAVAALMTNAKPEDVKP